MPQQVLRKTKIIATLGPTTETGNVLRDLLQAGVNVFRLDAACTERESSLKAVYTIRSISTELRQPVSLLFDAGVVAANSEEDWAKVCFGLECGADWMAVSTEAGTGVLRQLRQFLAEQKRNHIGTLARVEGCSDADNLGPAIAEADGILVAPGNLDAGTLDQWRRMVTQCRAVRKPVVLVTRLGTTVDVQSESGEVASLVRIQPDALLVQETGAGGLPLQSVQQLDGLIRRAESDAGDEGRHAVALMAQRDETIATAVRQADETNAEAVVLFTQSGNSAALCAALRPRHTRVFAFTPDTRLARRLILHYAIEPQILSFSDQSKRTIRAAEKLLLERKLLRPGAKIVFVIETLVEGGRLSSVQDRALGKS